MSPIRQESGPVPRKDFLQQRGIELVKTSRKGKLVEDTYIGPVRAISLLQTKMDLVARNLRRKAPVHATSFITSDDLQATLYLTTSKDYWVGLDGKPFPQEANHGVVNTLRTFFQGLLGVRGK